MTRPSKICRSCMRPVAPDGLSCPYCGDSIPEATRRRRLAIAAALFMSAILTAFAILFGRALGVASAYLLHSRPMALFASIAAIAAFAPFPRIRAGAANSGGKRLIGELALATLFFLLPLAMIAMAVAAIVRTS